jgi:superfamily II DNA/RNA helicase
VHGDLGQGAREQALRAFRAGKIDVLVATDVAARGIDVAGVTHVVNYQCPEDEKVYLHRIGRTGRAGESGVAVTFVDWDDIARWQMVNRTLELPFPDPPETYSTSPHLYEALDIPAGVKGTLPRASRTRAGLGAEAVEDLGETGKRRRGARPAGTTDNRSQPAQPTGSPAPGKRRDRKRTRGNGAAAESANAVVEAGTDSPADASGDATTGDGPARRRRRRRGGRGNGSGPNGTANASAESGSGSAVAEAS